MQFFQKMDQKFLLKKSVHVHLTKKINVQKYSKNVLKNITPVVPNISQQYIALILKYLFDW